VARKSAVRTVAANESTGQLDLLAELDDETTLTSADNDH